MKNTFLLVLVLSCFSIISVSQETAIYLEAANNIDYNEYNRNLEFLSSDALEGRNTGSEGYAKAADYVASEFNNNGLQPFGDNGSFFQKVSLTKREVKKSSVQFQLKNKSAVVNGIYGENISFLLNQNYDKIDEKQKLVFVGYGNILLDENINDYEGIDVNGKTVIVVLGGPKSVKSSGLFDPFLKVQNAISKGASGIILFLPNKMFQGLIFNKMHGFLGEPMVSLTDTSIGGAMFDFDLKLGAFAKKDLINEIFKLNGLKLGKELRKIEKGSNQSKELESTLNYVYEIKKESIDCKNVVAFLPGSDSLLNKEFVVVGAHLDHVGIGNPVKGDSIYNGMWDNATGSATLISIAKAYHDASIKPKRSLVFISYTGEEKGLLGSKYYVNRNTINKGEIVANINIDMLGGLFETTDIIPMGYSHSNLSEAVDFAAKHLSFVIDDNKQEEDEYFLRSDQASFIESGVPVLNVANGYTAVNTKINGKKEIDQWMKKYYHSPFDDINQKYSKEVFLQAIKLQFLTTYYITNMLEEIKWNEESWMYKKYVLEEK